MYKVFVNNKPLTFGTNRLKLSRNIPYFQESDFGMAIDLLNHNAEHVHIYNDDIDNIWNTFQKRFYRIHAAGGVVFNQDNEMLWIYRLDKWDLPKGKMEEGEDMETTAVREVEEECGITNLSIRKKLIDTYHIYYHKEYILKITHWYEMEYASDEQLIPQLEEGITKVAWKKASEWRKLAENSYGNIKTLIGPYLN